MLTEKQLELIERLVAGEELVKDILKDLDIPKSTYYDWRRGNKTFQQAYDEAIEQKVIEARKNIKINVNKYIDRLDNLSRLGNNEQARVNAITKILTMGELDPEQSKETNTNVSDDQVRNKMLELLQQEKEKDKQNE